MSPIHQRMLLLTVPCLLLWFIGPLSGNDNPEQRRQNQLAVQVALDRGKELIQQGNFAGAIGILEPQIPYIDGNRQFLSALCDAYRGQVLHLEKTGKTVEAEKLRGFLVILEPSGIKRNPMTGASSAGTVQPVAALEEAPGNSKIVLPVHRGKMAEEDPFAENNRSGQKGKNLIGRAERAFSDRNYDQAAKLFAQAEKAEPGCTSASTERWAYCRLFCVAQNINRPGEIGTNGVHEQEIREAVRQAPRLQSFGQSLLDRLQGAVESSGAEGNLEIRHTPGKAGSWAVAETINFRMFHQLNEEQAEKMIRICEKTRQSMTRRWFREEAKNWNPRCDVYLHPNGQVYSKATGAPAAAPGHSSISMEGGRVAVRRVDLRADDPNLSIGVLPHETTHVVLAGRFGQHHVPRWADEGMAVLSEPQDRIQLHLRNLAKHQREGTLFPLSELMRMAEYPEPRRIGPFYAQSVSVVEFLCRKKDHASFAQFLREALDGGYEVALEKYYGYQGFQQLEADWKRHAFNDASIANLAE